MGELDNQLPTQENTIGDHNVERLITNAYQPEMLDPEFVKRVHASARAASQEVRRPSNLSPSNSSRSSLSPSNSSPADSSPTNSLDQQKPSLWLAVVSISLVVVLIAGRFVTSKVEHYADGELIWINGRPYAPATSGSSGGSHETVLAPVPITDVSNQGNRRQQLRVGSQGLIPRKSLAGPRPEQVAIGDSIATTGGERRRVELPDKSVLFLNEKASVKVDGERRLIVENGEVFVEVSPAASHSGNPFVVATPDREVTALGTKFAVKVNATGTDVAVTQGKVKISGVERMLMAGHQTHGTEFSPLPRASQALYWTRELIAAAESPLIPASDYSGGALVAVDPNGQQTKLSLRKYDIDVHIEDGFARTTIDQTYFNHEQGRLEGTFYFPLPPDASISRLAMYVNGRLMEGGMAEREHARNVFETIKYRSLDPALLEWVDGSTFKMRVFPLEGRQEKRIILSYTQRLDKNYNHTRYRFPAGHNMNVVRDWSVQLHIVRGASLRWESPSHDLKSVTSGGNLTLTAHAKNVKTDRDVVLSLFDEPQNGKTDSLSERSQFSTVEHDGWRYLMLRFRPELKSAQHREHRDWVFLLDADGSRDPLLARAQVDIVKSLLKNAEHEDTFSIVTAGTRVRAFAPNQTPITPENVAAAVTFLDEMHLIGALNLEQAIKAAGNYVTAADRPVLVHVGSGIPILGERAIGKLVELLAKDAPYVGVGVGKRWNQAFMKTAASRTGGYFTQINPDESIPWRAFELLSSLNTPRLLDIRVTADHGQAQGQAQEKFLTMKDWVAHGEEICAVTRLQQGQSGVESVTVSGSVGGQAYHRTISASNVEERAEYLPRMWAKLAIDDMVARDVEQNKSRIIELSKSMYVMSPYTSLLVLENDEMYQQYKVDRGRKDHWAMYPCPETIEVVHEPIQGPQPAVTSQPGDEPIRKKPSLEEVLRTLFVRNSDFRSGTTVQLPTFSFTTVSTTVGAPDRGTVLLGAIRRLREGRTEPDLPMLSKLPYVNHLFTNGRFDETADPLMLMVTPRIIIQEEEEQRLGLLTDNSLSMRGDRNQGYYREGGAAAADFDELVKLIENTISPNTWEKAGGQGAIESFPTNLSLVISQSQHVLEQNYDSFIATFAADLPRDKQNFISVAPEVMSTVVQRNARLLQVTDEATGIPNLTQPLSNNFGTVLLTDGLVSEAPLQYPNAQVWSELTRHRQKFKSISLGGTAEQRISAELEKASVFDYQARSLQEVIDDLSSRLGIPIVINRKAIEDQGIPLETPITFAMKGPLKSALTGMLNQINLTYVIADEVLQITTPAHKQRLSRLYWPDEMLLLFRRDDSNVTAGASHESRVRFPVDDARQVDRWARILTQRLSQSTGQNSTGQNSTGQNSAGQNSAGQPSLLYLQPPALGNRRPFRLVSLAPAITTTKADILAVLEKEADLKHSPTPGKVDERAREWIEAARRQGWQLVTLRGPEKRTETVSGMALATGVLEVTIDGKGRFRFERRTEYGLGETVVCDGETLRHLYPELGLGATRRMSRFHRADLVRLVPWLVPPVEDLALGADLRLIGPNTVAVAPHGFDKAKDDENRPLTYVRMHLVFAEDGRLAERRAVEMPSGKPLLRVTYAADGTIRWFDDKNKQQGELEISVAKTAAPDLSPDTNELVVLPMPIRDRAHVYQIAKNSALNSAAVAEKSDALQAIAKSEQRRADDPAHWNEEDALRLLAASHWQNADELQAVIGRRFFARGDRRLGFYTLLLSSGKRWETDSPPLLNDGTTTRMDPLADHPRSSLARYIDRQLRDTPSEVREGQRPTEEPPHEFITQLAEYQELCARWDDSSDPPGDAEVRRRELDELFNFISRCDSPTFAFTLLRRLQRRYGDSQPHGRIAEAIIELENRGTTSYVVKYELARSLASSGDQEQAQRLFIQLYREALDEGILPPIDKAFRAAVQERSDPFGSDDKEKQGLTGLMRGACARLIERKQRPIAIALAWQCRQLDDAALGDDLIDRVLTGVPDDEQVATTLAALEYLAQAGKHDRADALLKPLLSHQLYSESPALWWLASRIASDGRRLARSANYLERALDLEYENLPNHYNVELVRENYRQLFASYRELARTLAVPHADPPLGLARRAIKAADRWRSLETDVTTACNEAANVLSELGEDELAWDYLTTPLATRPNEAVGWLNLAHTLSGDGKIDLAVRAYEAAFESEPTNAQILWDQAELLSQAGRSQQAQSLYRKIANGEWQPRFDRIKQQAQQAKLRD